MFHLQLLGVEGDSLIKHSGLTSMKDLVETINVKLSGWGSYFRVGNSNRAFSEICDYAEMKIRTLLARRKRWRKTSICWMGWSSEYIYGILGLYWDWKLDTLKTPEAYRESGYQPRRPITLQMKPIE